jgi:hypothetical protein
MDAQKLTQCGGKVNSGTSYFLRCAIPLLIISLGAAATARGAAVLPPDLVALAQRMAQLQLHSERFSFGIEADGVERGGAPRHVTIAAAVGEARVRDPGGSTEGSLDITLFGRHEVVRFIDHTLYEDRPRIARIDGGRPWVRSRASSANPASAPLEIHSGFLREHPWHAGQGTFASLVADIGEVESAVEVGATAVDGQAVTQFDLTFPPAPSGEPLGENSPGFLSASGEAPGAVSLTLELFVAADGLPVRMRTSRMANGFGVAVVADILATEIPVHISAPPVSRTIGKAQLERIEARRLRRGRGR